MLGSNWGTETYGLSRDFHDSECEGSLRQSWLRHGSRGTVTGYGASWIEHSELGESCEIEVLSALGEPWWEDNIEFSKLGVKRSCSGKGREYVFCATQAACSLSQQWTLPPSALSSRTRYVHERAPLGTHTLYLYMDTEIWISYNFHVLRNVVLPLIFSNHLKMWNHS